jgi:hypothetical protein
MNNNKKIEMKSNDIEIDNLQTTMEIPPYKVYKIAGAGMTYYGSTIQVLYERKASHMSLYKMYKNGTTPNKCMCYKIFDATDDYSFEIIECCFTKEDMLAREDWYIRNCDCVNVQGALPKTEEEQKKYNAEWAMKKARANGVQPKKHWTEEDHKKYKADWFQAKKAGQTEEELREQNDKANAKSRAKRLAEGKIPRLNFETEEERVAYRKEYNLKAYAERKATETDEHRAERLRKNNESREKKRRAEGCVAKKIITTEEERKANDKKNKAVWYEKQKALQI